jgi:hypothetical protein
MTEGNSPSASHNRAAFSGKSVRIIIRYSKNFRIASER